MNRRIFAQVLATAALSSAAPAIPAAAAREAAFAQAATASARAPQFSAFGDAVDGLQRPAL